MANQLREQWEIKMANAISEAIYTHSPETILFTTRYRAANAAIDIVREHTDKVRAWKDEHPEFAADLERAGVEVTFKDPE